MTNKSVEDGNRPMTSRQGVEPDLGPPSLAGDQPRPLIGLRQVEKSFGGVRAVADATFDVAPGRVTGLIGPNGAGKSTVINLIAGALSPDSGTIQFAGNDITGLPAHRIARLGIVRTFQKANLFPRLTVLENMLAAVPGVRGDSLGAALLGKWYWRSAEAEQVTRAQLILSEFEMDRYANTYAADLSGGEKRIVELMRSLMPNPRLLILDEPMAGINPTRAREIGTHLRRLNAGGLAMLLVEHEMAFVEAVCDQVIVMAMGAVLAEGRMSDLRSNEDVVNAYLS